MANQWTNTSSSLWSGDWTYTTGATNNYNTISTSNLYNVNNNWSTSTTTYPAYKFWIIPWTLLPEEICAEIVWARLNEEPLPNNLQLTLPGEEIARYVTVIAARDDGIVVRTSEPSYTDISWTTPITTGNPVWTTVTSGSTATSGTVTYSTVP